MIAASLIIAWAAVAMLPGQLTRLTDFDLGAGAQQ